VYKLVTPEEKKLLMLRYEHRLGQREPQAHGRQPMQVSRLWSAGFWRGFGI
jgi:hypothetical protein